MSAHTPGPWFYEKPFFVTTNHHAICRMKNTLRDDTEANARLISAAPDLLEALMDLTTLYEISSGRDPVFVSKARAAIAKARGDGS